MKKYLFLIGLAFALQGFGFFCLVFEIDPYRHYFYVTSWWSYIILVDTVLAFKQDEFLVLNRDLPQIILISSGYWSIFELLNLRLQNWHYVDLPSEPILRYAGYLLSYGTVVPAIYVTKGLLQGLLTREWNVKALRPISGYPAYAISSGILALVLALSFPGFAFPLVWVFPVLVLDGYNYLRGYRSFMGDLETGSLTGLVLSLASGMICGLLWEAWNYRAVSKWVYTLPLVQDTKLFEMPLPGYLGFPAFGVATIAFVYLLKGMEHSRMFLYILAGVSAVSSLTVFSLIDHHTVLSFVRASR